MFTARLIAYSPAGDRLTDLLLDGVSWDAQMPLNDVAALSLNYPSVVDGIGLASEPVEIAVEISDGGDWVEPRNARFLTSEVDSDLVAPLDVPGLKFRGLGALLERPLILRESENEGKPYNSDGKRNFLSASAGQIVTSVLNESRARYATMLQGVTLGFTASTDSNGSAWGKLDSVAYEPGTDLLRILDDLASRGVIDWWMRGRELNIVNGDSMAMDTGVIVPLLDAESAPVRMTHESRATHVAVEGGQSKVWEQPVPGASVPYGAKIIRIANDSITTEGTAGDLIQRQIVQATGSRREYTTSLPLVDAAPFIDFHVGDWVLARTGSVSVDEAGLERVRVHAVTIRWDQSAATVGCDLTLNDRFVDASVRDAKRMQGISHGVTQVLGDGGLPSRSDRAIPAAPTGVVGNSLGYWNGAIPLSSMDVSWNAVESDVDGLALNGVDYYEIRVGGQTKRAESTTVGFDGLQPSRIYDITVRAISSTGIAGRWSAPVSVLTDYPLPNLDPPTQPTFRTENAAVEVMWDGMLEGSGAAYAPPRHFSHTLVEVRPAGGSWTRYERDQGWVLVGLTAGDSWSARLVAVDALGRESEPSPVGTVVVKSAAQDAQVRADDAWEEAGDAKAAAQTAANRIDAVEGVLDTTAQTAQDAWNLALEATANATQRINLVPNPSFELDTASLTVGAGIAAVESATSGEFVWQGERALRVTMGTPSSATSLVVRQNVPVESGKFLAFSVRVARTGDAPISARIAGQWRPTNAWFTSGSYQELEWSSLSDDTTRMVFVVAVPDGVTHADIGVQFAGPGGSWGAIVPGSEAWTEGWIAGAGDSEAAALVAISPYFDGGTEDRTDTAGILYQTAWTGTPHASTSVETAYTSAMLEIIAEAHAATEAAHLAGQKADEADSEARQARQEVADAFADIQDAFTQIGAKADILIQPNEPTAAMRKPTTLWIDTTGGANTPKRWNGSVWDPITDQAVADAAQAAADAYERATQALNAAGGKNRIFRSVSLPGSSQGEAVGDVWWRYAESTLQGPIIGQWTWDGDQWRPSLIDSQIIANLTVDKLVVAGGAIFPTAVVDTLVGQDAFLSRVAANQVLVGPGNLAPSFRAESAWEVTRAEIINSSRSDTGRAVQFTSGQPGESIVHGPIFPVTGGQDYYVETKLGRIGSSYANGGRWYLGLRVVNADGSHVSYKYALSAMVDSASWDTKLFGTVSLPGSAEYARVRIVFQPATGTPVANAHTTLYDIVCRQMVGTVMLGDGVVSAPKIASSAIKTDHLSAGALDAFRIRSPLFESVATANRGIKWINDQFVAYNNSGQEMIRLAGNTGEITGVTVTGGRVQTAATGARLLMTNSTAGFPSLWMYDNTNSGHRVILQTNASGALFAFADGAGQDRLRLDASGTMTMWAPNGQNTLSITATNNGSYGNAWLQGPLHGTSRAQIHLGVETSGGTTSSTASVSAGNSADRAWLAVHGGGTWWLGSNTRGRINMDNSSGELLLYPRSGLLSFYNLPTTASTGQPITMIVGGSGMPSIYRHTSVRASKTHIEDLDVDPYKVLELRPRTFYDRYAWERYANALTVEHDREHDQEPDPEIAVHEGTQYPDRLVGFIAEEVAELFPELVSYDDQGNLAGVQYDRVSGHLLLAVKALKTELDNLKENLGG